MGYDCKAKGCMDDKFVNYKFKAMRESGNEEFEFSFVDLPTMNPHELFMLLSIFNMENDKFGNQISPLKKMLIFYFWIFVRWMLNLLNLCRRKRRQLSVLVINRMELRV